MSSVNVFGEKASILFALVLTLIGLGLNIAAILLPSWQVVNLREYNSIHEHGLWLDCTRHSRDGNANVLLRRYATISEPLHCVYKFDYDKYSGTFDLEDDNSPVGEVNRHKFYGWHSATLILLGLALLTAFLSICIGLCSCCYGSLSLIFTVVTLLTTFLSTIAVGLFFFFSHRADNRFIKGIVGTYEQRVGLAFFLEMAAALLHFLAFLTSLLFAYFSFSKKTGISDHYSLNRSSKTNMTNVARSMEFEPQMMYQQNIAASNLRPPYYTKHQEQYEKNVAESMPELGIRQFSNEVLSERVRRKSETCV
uniref:Cre-nsy-4 protein n=1 Tax=Anisakis simplex TaxID=6269 RepID=A0A346RVK4_ANISI|nr:cre-nsy-4 protein [Anisakis simplex]